MKIKKRNKRSRLRGARTCGYGFRQKHKGHGNKGGFGMAGTGKRASQKQQKALMMAKKLGIKYFGKQGFTSRKTKRKKEKKINLKDIAVKFKGKEIELSGYKILGEGDGFKAVIKASEASKGAIEKMKKAGGKIIIENKKEERDENDIKRTTS